MPMSPCQEGTRRENLTTSLLLYGLEIGCQVFLPIYLTSFLYRSNIDIWLRNYIKSSSCYANKVVSLKSNLQMSLAFLALPICRLRKASESLLFRRQKNLPVFLA